MYFEVKCFENCFSEANVRNPILAKPLVLNSIIAIFFFPIYAIAHQFACCFGHFLFFAASISHLVMFHAGKMHRKKYCERLG